MSCTARSARSSASIAVGVEVALVILIVGLTSGLLQETAKRIEGIGADIMLQPPSASVFLAFSGAPMPIKIGDKLRELKLRAGGCSGPVAIQFFRRRRTSFTGSIRKVFRDVSGGFVFLEGHDMQGPDDILLDDWAAKANTPRWAARSACWTTIFTWPESWITARARVYSCPSRHLQDLSGSRDKASLFFIKCTRPDHTQAVMDDMQPIFQGYEIRPLKDFLSLMSFREPARSRRFYRQHDRARRIHRLPRDPAFDVHHRDRADARYRRSEIHRRVQGIYHSGAARRIGLHLRDRHCRGDRFELCRRGPCSCLRFRRSRF